MNQLEELNAFLRAHVHIGRARKALNDGTSAEIVAAEEASLLKAQRRVMGNKELMANVALFVKEAGDNGFPDLSHEKIWQIVMALLCYLESLKNESEL